jgi:hypothetical protein
MHDHGKPFRLIYGVTEGMSGASTVSRIEAATLSPGQRFATACDEAFPQMGGWFSRFYHDSRTRAGRHPSGTLN